jgi:uncharacterized membrane protein YciS (DUF1049 family)
MKSVVKWIILLPVVAAAVGFAVANRHPVTIFFNPLVNDDQDYAVVVPLFLVLIFVLMVGVIIGGIAAWLVQGKHRRAARRARAEIDRLKTHIPQVRF